MDPTRESSILKEYYARRAAEYDDAYTGRGRWPFTDAPGLEAEIPILERFVAELPQLATEMGDVDILLSTSWFLAVEKIW